MTHQYSVLGDSEGGNGEAIPCFCHKALLCCVEKDISGDALMKYLSMVKLEK